MMAVYFNINNICVETCEGRNIYVTVERTGAFANSSPDGDGYQHAVSTPRMNIDEICKVFPDLATEVIVRMVKDVFYQLGLTSYDDSRVYDWAEMIVRNRA